MRINYLIFYCLLLGATSCVEDYPPPVSSENVDFLVVDGFINNTEGSLEVRLTRAVPLDSEETPPPELNAQLVVEDSEGGNYPLSDFGNGFYQNNSIATNSNLSYRLRIKRADGREYLSEYVSLKNTPPIDSVIWRPNQFSNAIQILVNTHDETNNARYYQWTFEETHEYTSVFNSLYKYENGEVVDRQPADYIYRCWQTVPSKKIIIGTSENLSTDIISNFIVNEVPSSSPKLILKYSILVKQRALSKAAYTYWFNLQRTTENLGGLFDPQPGRVNGNISNISNPGEPVIGYFDIATIQEKRISISSRDLPDGMRPSQDLMGCQVDSVEVDLASEVGMIPSLSFVNAIYSETSPDIIGYTFSSVRCADCRLQGGTTERPLFWE